MNTLFVKIALKTLTYRRELLLCVGGIYIGWQLINGWFKPFLSQNPVWFWITDMLLATVIPLLLYKMSGLSNLGLSKNDFSFANIGKFIAYVVAGIVIIIIAFTPLLFVQTAPWIEPIVPFSYMAMLPSAHDNRVMMFVGKAYFALSAAVFEEWVYRYYLNDVLAPWLASWKVRTLLLSSLFALVHWEGGGYNVIFAFCIGLLFAWVLRRRRSLFPIIVMHFSIDFFALT